MNKARNKENRDKLVSTRVNSKLYKLCFEHYKNSNYTQYLANKGSSFSDLIEYLLQEFAKGIPQ